jgi:Carboxypeptidase regulatory-like domain
MKIKVKKFDVNSLRTASPCTADWASMQGDERTRHCDGCHRNVYNVSELTVREVEHLIAAREGRLCFRMYRRVDGTLLTRDCPVGLVRLRKRTAMFAGACLSAIVGVFTASYGQTAETSGTSDTEIKIVRVKADQTLLAGTIVDSRGAIVTGVEVVIREVDHRVVNIVRSDDHGNFAVSVPAGTYELDLTVPGYPLITSEQIQLIENETAELSIKLTREGNVTMGVVVDLPVVPSLPILTVPAPQKTKKPKQ